MKKYFILTIIIIFPALLFVLSGCLLPDTGLGGGDTCRLDVSYNFNADGEMEDSGDFSCFSCFVSVTVYNSTCPGKPDGTRNESMTFSRNGARFHILSEGPDYVVSGNEFITQQYDDYHFSCDLGITVKAGYFNYINDTVILDTHVEVTSTTDSCEYFN